MGSDQAKMTAKIAELISIHAPAWGATLGELHAHVPVLGFQSTLPHGERPGDANVSAASMNFNPRSRMGSDKLRVDAVVRDGISIHAPAWGATAGAQDLAHVLAISIHAPAWGATFCGPMHPVRRYRISIHAPAWGATSGTRRSGYPTSDFNPRSRMGSDWTCRHRTLPA